MLEMQNADGGTGMSMMTLFVIAIFYSAITIIPVWKIFQRAGLSGWWSIVMALPALNLFILFYLAFTDWPAVDGRNRAMQPPPANARTIPPGAVPPSV